MSEKLKDLSLIINNLGFMQLHEQKTDDDAPQILPDNVNLPCKMPQTASETDYGVAVAVDAAAAVDSETILVDTSVVSCYRPSLLLAESSIESSPDPYNICESEVTISETDSEEEMTPSKRASDGPDGLTPPKRQRCCSKKRKHESLHSSESDSDSYDSDSIIVVDSSIEQLSCQSMEALRLESSSTQTSGSADAVVTTTTRSGRKVRPRIDIKFDYSSEQHQHDTDDDDEETDEEDDCDSDDDDDDEDYIEEVCEAKQKGKCTPRKQRRLTSVDYSSGSNSNSSGSNSSTPEKMKLIYLDLSEPVAVVMAQPAEGTVADQDVELKTRLEKLLGLIPSKRRLYNPVNNFELDYMETDELPFPRSRLIAASTPAKQVDVANFDTPTVKVTVTEVPPLFPFNALPQSSTPMHTKLRKQPHEQLTHDQLERKYLDDLVSRVNVNFIESQTPLHIKEPIDLSGLPNQKERARNCRQHNAILSCLEQHPAYYTFVESFSADTPVALCHPRACVFKKRAFENCRKLLAQTLFKMFNHKIFYCGLKQLIEWKRNGNTNRPLSSCELSIEPGGKRVAQIQLSEGIRQPGVLIKLLLHEMCHAAAFVYNGETGHGDGVRKWAFQAKLLMPELPVIGDCEPIYKYTCCLCRAHACGNSDFEAEAPLFRCHYCQFELVVDTYDNDVHNLSFSHQRETRFKTFIKEQYMLLPDQSYTAKIQKLNEHYLSIQTI